MLFSGRKEISTLLFIIQLLLWGVSDDSSVADGEAELSGLGLPLPGTGLSSAVAVGAKPARL